MSPLFPKSPLTSPSPPLLIVSSLLSSHPPSQPASLTGATKPAPGGEDHSQLFAQMIARTAKDIEVNFIVVILVIFVFSKTTKNIVTGLIRCWWTVYLVRKAPRNCRSASPHHHDHQTIWMTLQAAGLASLETESEQAGEALAETVKQGEKLLQSIQVLILHNHHGLKSNQNMLLFTFSGCPA